MTRTEELRVRLRARMLFMRLKDSGHVLTAQQYATCRGWITAGQLDTAEAFMRRHGIIKGRRTA